MSRQEEIDALINQRQNPSKSNKKTDIQEKIETLRQNPKIMAMVERWAINNGIAQQSPTEK